MDTKTIYPITAIILAIAGLLYINTHIEWSVVGATIPKLFKGVLFILRMGLVIIVTCVIGYPFTWITKIIHRKTIHLLKKDSSFLFDLIGGLSTIALFISFCVLLYVIHFFGLCAAIMGITTFDTYFYMMNR